MENEKTGKREDAKAPEVRKVYSKSGITTCENPRGDQQRLDREGDRYPAGGRVEGWVIV